MALLAPGTALAQLQVSAYGGANTANDSVVHLDQGGDTRDFDVDWFGDSENKPPYWGVRGTYWLGRFGQPSLGVALDYTHAKVKADLDDPDLAAEFDTLEFTDGLNTGTLNLIYEAPITSRFDAYVGAGAGIAVPHVEVKTKTIPFDTFQYQLAGPDVQALVGGSLKIGYGLAAFAEYKANMSWNDTDLEGGGSLDTNVLTHQLAVGLSYRFDALGW